MKNSELTYIPEKGDLVWIDFDPSAGSEIQKRRPALIISNYDFNRTTLFAVACPITSTIKSAPTRYSLPKGLEISGQILIHQLKSLDFLERKLTYVDHLPTQHLGTVQQLVQYIF